jgi:hypothetical protein
LCTRERPVRPTTCKTSQTSGRRSHLGEVSMLTMLTSPSIGRAGPLWRVVQVETAIDRRALRVRDVLIRRMPARTPTTRRCSSAASYARGGRRESRERRWAITPATWAGLTRFSKKAALGIDFRFAGADRNAARNPPAKVTAGYERRRAQAEHLLRRA